MPNRTRQGNFLFVGIHPDWIGNLSQHPNRGGHTGRPTNANGSTGVRVPGAFYEINKQHPQSGHGRNPRTNERSNDDGSGFEINGRNEPNATFDLATPYGLGARFGRIAADRI